MIVIDLLNDNSPAVTAITATLTVVITCFYIRQIEKQRHEMIKPNIWLNSFNGTINDTFGLTFWNIGKGNAFEVHIECLFSKNAILKKLSLNYFKYLFGFQFIKAIKINCEPIRFFPTDGSEFIEVELSPVMVIRKYTCVKIKVVYIDELGKKQKTKKYYNLKDFSF